MGVYGGLTESFRDEWHVEDGLATARIPQITGDEVRAVVEAMPDGGWDWSVWRFPDVPGAVWSGRAMSLTEAMAATQRVARLICLAPGQMMSSAGYLHAVA